MTHPTSPSPASTGATPEAPNADKYAVTQETAARMLEVSTQTFRKWEKSGAITPVYRGKLKRYLADDVRSILVKR